MTSFAQVVLLEKLNIYLKSQRRKKINEEGYCHGLTLLWLHHISQNTEKDFYRLSKKIICSKTSEFKDFENQIENFLSNIEWLQNSCKYQASVNQFDIDKLLEANSKLHFSAIFNSRDLAHVLELSLLPNKMICLSNIDHTVGLYCKDNKYYLYNPNYESGEAQVFQHINRLQEEIINCFNKTDKPLHKIPLVFNILDREKSCEPEKQIDRKAILKLLTNSTAKVLRVDHSGTNSLHLAAELDDTENIKILLSKNSPIDALDNEDRTALNLATLYGHEAAVSLLLQQGSNPRLACNDGSTSLHNACENGFDKIVKMLLPYFPDIDIIDDEHRTSLFRAAENNKISTIKILLNLNANPLSESKNKNTSLHAALTKKNWLASLLLMTKITEPEKVAKKTKYKIFEKLLKLQNTLRMHNTEFSTQEYSHCHHLLLTLALAPPKKVVVEQSFFAKNKEIIDEDTPEPQYRFCAIL